mmetsp:Transcript_124714/g.360788  ORF Transcript_124714/g.360788 Transcript_124714/m.360788 type:complete len:254 (+) Transcript_124714:40-801(+)
MVGRKHGQRATPKRDRNNANSRGAPLERSECGTTWRHLADAPPPAGPRLDEGVVVGRAPAQLPIAVVELHLAARLTRPAQLRDRAELPRGLDLADRSFASDERRCRVHLPTLGVRRQGVVQRSADDVRERIRSRAAHDAAEPSAHDEPETLAALGIVDQLEYRRVARRPCAPPALDFGAIGAQGLQLQDGVRVEAHPSNARGFCAAGTWLEAEAAVLHQQVPLGGPPAAEGALGRERKELLQFLFALRGLRRH